MPLKRIRVRLRDDHSQTQWMAEQSLLVFGHLWEPIPDDTAVDQPPGQAPAADGPATEEPGPDPAGTDKSATKSRGHAASKIKE